MIQLFKPYMDEAEVEAVGQVIRSGWIGLGPKTAEFERELGDYLKVPYVVGLNSCTAALDLAIRLLDIHQPSDEVIVPTMTFVSTGHAVLYSQATPVFADVDPVTLNINIEDVARKLTPRTRAVIVVHYGGRPVDINQLRQAVGQIPVVEDAAHAMGSEFEGKKCGSLTEMGCLSFHAVKNLATGDGGGLTLKDNDRYLRAKRLRWLGIDKGTWDRTEGDRSYLWEYGVDEVGFKCHMNDITAAIGLAQLRKLTAMNARRLEIAMRYTKELGDLPWLQTPPMDTADSISSWHLYVVQCDGRDALNAYLQEKGIATGVHYKPIHRYACYGDQPSLPVAERMFKRILSLPMHPGLSDDDVRYVIHAVRSFPQATRKTTRVRRVANSSHTDAPV